MKNSIKFLVLLLSFYGFSQSSDKKVSEYNLEKNVAIDGYDPVGYFTENKAIKGKKEIKATNDGVIYYFSSEKNKNLFVKNPKKYEPQYGGWCAYAMGLDGSKVEIDPKTFKIVDGKLYLFYNKLFNNTLKTWNKEEPKLMKNANNYWTKTLKN